MTPELIRDPEFSRFVPPLSKKELELLEQSILREGCRDAIVTWNGVILDGHNRYTICTRHGLPFNTKEILLESRDDMHKPSGPQEHHRREQALPHR